MRRRRPAPPAVVGLSPAYSYSRAICPLTYPRFSGVMFIATALRQDSSRFRHKCLTADPAGGSLRPLRLPIPCKGQSASNNKFGWNE